jgi:putative ABC transport system substrate-binding protein
MFPPGRAKLPTTPQAIGSAIFATIGIGTYRAFFGELRRLGYIEGQNLIVERYFEGNIAHWAELAREVVRHQPDLIFAHSTRMTLRFKEAASTMVSFISLTGRDGSTIAIR